MSRMIENHTYEELNVGQSHSMSRTISEDDIVAFAAVTHDTNPAHLDHEYAQASMFKGVIAHGMWTAGLISAILGTRFPGFGTIYLGQDLQFRRPVRPGDTVTVTVTVKSKNDEKKTVELDCVATNQNDEKVVVGTARILAPSEKIRHESIEIPKIEIKK